MELNNLTAISPIDGRYRKQVVHLDEYFSEYALMKYRVIVEIEYFLFLADKKFFKLNAKARLQLRKVAEEFSLDDAQQIKGEEDAARNPQEVSQRISNKHGGADQGVEGSRHKSGDRLEAGDKGGGGVFAAYE